MDLRIVNVKTKRQIRDFVEFQLEHYKGNPYYVPPIIADEMAVFMPDKNPAFETAELQLFLAYRGDKIVGRIGAIVSHAANEKYNYKNMRFSWIEFTEDYEVCKLLLDTAIEWGRQRGMTTVSGPHGFNDFDMQGMLVEGYDKMATIASFYNYSYYPEYLERYGFEKEIDFIEYLSTPTGETNKPEQLFKVSDYVRRKNNIHFVEYSRTKDYIMRAPEIFSLLETAFDKNFGTVPLTANQIKYYTKKYLLYLSPKLIKLAENEKGELVGFVITMPNMSEAFRKANGHMFPTGIFHVLKAMRSTECLDFYFLGVHPDYRKKGVDAVIVSELLKTVMEMGFKKTESNQLLENNTMVQAMWKFYSPVNHKRRRIFKKTI